MLDHRHVIAFMALAGALVTSTSARAQPPAGRYVVGVDHDNGGGFPDVATVYDTQTKLTWQQDAGDPVPLAQVLPVSNLGCSTLTNQTSAVGWRLPTLRELFTLFDFAGSGTIDGPFFPNTPEGSFLSVTSSTANPVQCASFGGNFFNGCGLTVNVRCVR